MAEVAPAETLVLKLGGSLSETGRLGEVAALVAQATVPVVVVPGGGPFADTVRMVEPALDIPQALSHRLALLAMHQMGLVIEAKSPRYHAAETLEDIASEIVLGAVPVWMPFALQHDDPTLPADWRTTSDALAARLAERLGGASVALVKACEIPPHSNLKALTAAGVVDPKFGEVVTRAGLSWRVYGPRDEAALRARLGLLD